MGRRGAGARAIARQAPERVRALVLVAMSTRGDVFRRQSMLDRPGDLERSGEIRCPTLVVRPRRTSCAAWKKRGRWQPPSPAPNWSSSTTRATPIEAPQRLIDVIVPWLAAHTR